MIHGPVPRALFSMEEVFSRASLTVTLHWKGWALTGALLDAAIVFDVSAGARGGGAASGVDTPAGTGTDGVRTGGCVSTAGSPAGISSFLTVGGWILRTAGAAFTGSGSVSGTAEAT